jgi:hypothetical protein
LYCIIAATALASGMVPGAAFSYHHQHHESHGHPPVWSKAKSSTSGQANPIPATVGEAP